MKKYIVVKEKTGWYSVEFSTDSRESAEALRKYVYEEMRNEYEREQGFEVRVYELLGDLPKAEA